MALDLLACAWLVHSDWISFASMSENEQQASAEKQNPLSSVKSETKVVDYKLLARMMIREGKTFKESALAAGYSASTSALGLRRLLRESKPFAEVYNRESGAFLALPALKPLAIRRLYTEIEDVTSSQGIKAIELAGRFKELDWWVRNVDVQIGVFASLGEPSPAEDSLEAYKTEE